MLRYELDDNFGNAHCTLPVAYTFCPSTFDLITVLAGGVLGWIGFAVTQYSALTHCSDQRQWVMTYLFLH